MGKGVITMTVGMQTKIWYVIPKGNGGIFYTLYANTYEEAKEWTQKLCPEWTSLANFKPPKDLMFGGILNGSTNWNSKV